MKDKVIRIGKLFTFEAAHHLPYHEGACKKVHGHGYKLEVVIEGIIKDEGPECGMIMDLTKLKDLVNTEIVNALDHTNLNDHFENPTAENMVGDIAERLYDIIYEIPAMSLVKVKLWETDTGYAEWRQEDQE